MKKMIKGADLETARAAKKKAMSLLGDLAQLNGVGITRLNEGYGVKVNLTEEPPEGLHLPEEVDGVPIKVEVVG